MAAAALSLGGCKKEEHASHAEHAANAQEAHEMHAMHQMDAGVVPPEGTGTLVDWRPVPADRVCMVNDRVFPMPQIPVAFEGRTYYGCCEGCKATLMNDRRARMAVDPVTGEEVDKATAVMGAFSNGSVLYFASAENRDAFEPAQAS